MAQRVTGALQHANVAVAEIIPSKVSDWAAAKKLFTLPQDALLTGRGWVEVKEAFDPGTSLTMDVGNGADDDEYTFDGAVDLTATAVTAMTQAAGAFAAQAFGETSEVQAVFALVGAAPTAGKAYIYMEYLRPAGADGVN